jgi:polyhydroxyalkanoate synthesis regulator phasin
LAELKKLHDTEKNKLNKDISDRDNKYAELNKQFEDAKKKAVADAELAKASAEKNLQEKLAELNKQHEIEKTKLNQDIENLRTLIGNSDKLFAKEKVSLSNRIKELEGQVIELSNKNSDLKTGKQVQSGTNTKNASSE